MKITFACVAFLLLLTLNAVAQKLGIRVLPMSITDTILLSETDRFYNSLVKKIIYHPIARENENSGKLTALFAIDSKRNIKYIRILKSPVDYLSNNVIDALKSISFPSTIKPNKPYIIPINFTLEWKPNPKNSKILPPVTVNSTIVYNPDNIKIPKHERALMLREITKEGFLYGTLDITVE
ncbi:MAG: energy transducer TonB [Mucilaginibacter sp.]|nr:energy transducer TonB [Mucilaginibacter sp.]